VEADGVELTDDEQRGAQPYRAGAQGPRRVEVITGQERRRRWSSEDKARITAESLKPGVNVSAIARRYGVSIGLLHYWRKCAREGVARTMRFVPVKVADEASEAAEPPAPGSAAWSQPSRSCIEIELGSVCIRVNGAVDAEALRVVMSAVRAAK
jgi:transposase